MTPIAVRRPLDRPGTYPEVCEAPETVGRLFDAWWNCQNGYTESHWWLKDALINHRHKWLIRGEFVFYLDTKDCVRVERRWEPYPRRRKTR